MTTYTLAELFDKRNEIAGTIIQLEKQVRALRADLGHIEVTIRILRPGTELPKVVPKRVEFDRATSNAGSLLACASITSVSTQASRHGVRHSPPRHRRAVLSARDQKSSASRSTSAAQNGEAWTIEQLPPSAYRALALYF